MESLKPKFFAKLNEEINRASANAMNKLVYTKGMYPKDLLLHVLQEIKDLGYNVVLKEEILSETNTVIEPETLTIQWKEDEDAKTN